MDSFNLGDLYKQTAQVASPVSTQPQTTTQTPTGVPTWNDLYKEYTNQDWFKNQQSAYGGQIDRRWNADDGTRAAKKAIDDLYITRLGEYNKANGTNYQADQSMLGADAQPNDWNHTQNESGGLLQHWGKAATESPVIRNAAILAASIYGGPAGAAAASAAISRAQGNDWDQVAANGLGAGALSYGVGQFIPGLSGGGTEGLSSMFTPAAESVGGGSMNMPLATGGELGASGVVPSSGALSMNMPLATGGELASSGIVPAGTGAATGIEAGAGASTGSFLSNLVGKGGSNIPNLLRAGSSLYSAYKGQQNADNTTNALQQQMQTLTDMYKEGSPWANQLRATLERKDAASGRNSQYGPREAQFQALLADKAGQNAGVLGQLATQAGTAGDRSNSYLNLVLNRLGDVANSTGLTKTVEDGVSKAANSAWDYFFS